MPKGGTHKGAGVPKRFEALQKKQYLLEPWMIERVKEEARQQRQSESEWMRTLLDRTLRREEQK
jgi:hypothetical protein